MHRTTDSAAYLKNQSPMYLPSRISDPAIRFPSGRLRSFDSNASDIIKPSLASDPPQNRLSSSPQVEEAKTESIQKEKAKTEPSVPVIIIFVTYRQGWTSSKKHNAFQQVKRGCGGEG
jgi:hypothetical protein